MLIVMSTIANSHVNNQDSQLVSNIVVERVATLEKECSTRNMDMVCMYDVHLQ